jgi:hypothetical protein
MLHDDPDILEKCCSAHRTGEFGVRSFCEEEMLKAIDVANTNKDASDE